ncbi:unnamed protein product, partial [Mesorhabditis belari]|uniref:Uncharacterized protein n=1 Tax=Mesorhabditis belari TaxID=2138241 RepID=A0AAF3FHY7_9BILA
MVYSKIYRESSNPNRLSIRRQQLLAMMSSKLMLLCLLVLFCGLMITVEGGCFDCARRICGPPCATSQSACQNCRQIDCGC